MRTCPTRMDTLPVRNYTLGDPLSTWPPNSNYKNRLLLSRYLFQCCGMWPRPASVNLDQINILCLNDNRLDEEGQGARGVTDSRWPWPQWQWQSERVNGPLRCFARLRVRVWRPKRGRESGQRRGSGMDTVQLSAGNVGPSWTGTMMAQ